MNDFETWWYNEGSGPPLRGEDGEEHCKRMCQIAWSNGAYIERLKSPSDSLLDEAKLLADDRPIEIGHLPEWTLDAEHMIRRLVKAFSSAPQPAPVQQEPVYQIKDYDSDKGWQDVEFSEYQTAPEARRIVYTSPQPAQQEPVGRADQQIVDQTEELAVWLLSWCFNHQPETSTPMRESTHPFAERCWAAACHIQEMLTATDPENSVAALDDSQDEGASPPAQQQPLTYAELMALAKNSGLGPENVSGLLQARLEIYGRAIEAKLKEKNQ